ncbi:flavohemoglobin expression-modulating QEGLA motif protein [Altibacter sp. HG106]|uniref:flavohemoglobin expression-modulating QEGLA motif protein n=1 Tax=Altibacter sp. HG106 TaxID=3023937 RepID=UPI00235051A6|nr:tyrosine/phenylalanine carboxypeptidase domain-containing protein [Altibacter sp. HG106]MDC7995393.1 DUF1704 domain-containing protein [Altibacter sp. HG106]
MQISEEKAIYEQQLDDIIGQIRPEGRTICPLPHGGHLFLEHDVPFLLIYRKRENDAATLRLARTGASYLIIGTESFDFFKELLHRITEQMADRFGSFLLLELFAGAQSSTEFVIKGPAHKLPASLEMLQTALANIDSRRYRVSLSARVEKTKERQRKSDSELFTIDHLKKLGGTSIGIEVPPVYRNAAGITFPVYFRKFRDQWADAIRKAVFEFVRVQTSSPLAHYHTLGKREIHKEVFKIDRQMAAIQSSYQFLLLVAPVNIQALRSRFFASDFKEINEYHYRLLPIDPDLLKRKLYNLRIDEIDDPALAYLFDEKREEIDHELTMLKERGSKNFLYSSIRLYKGLTKKVLSEAEKILEELPKDQPRTAEALIDAYQFRELATQEFEYFRGQSETFQSKVHIRDDVNIIMVSNGELYLPSDYTLSQKEAQALIQHEIGTHALTYYNGKQQPLQQLAVGLADYDALQEGLAVMAEYLIGGLNANRLRILAGRVLAGQLLLEGCGFKEIFRALLEQYGFTKENAFNITSRMFQGGGFMKDIIYLKGLVQLRDYLQEGGALKPLLAGKFALKHVEIIEDLTNRGLLLPPKVTPRYMQSDSFHQKLDAVKQGLALSKMI